MESSTLTVREKVQLKKGLTPEGRQVLALLQTQYQMTQDAAMRLMRDGGQLLAVAILSKGQTVMKSNNSRQTALEAELRRTKGQLLQTRLQLQAMQE